jgi:hypothetical protein
MAPGFTQIDDGAILRSGEVGASAFQVYAAIAQHVRDERRAWPGVERLAIITKLSARTIQYAITKLESSGWIVVERQRGRGNQYHLPPIESNATDCTTPGVSNATHCVTVTQPIASGNATGCGGVTQLVASEAYQRSIPRSKPEKQTNRGKAAVVEIPSELESDVFREAWGRWTAHRKEIKKTLTPSTTAAQLQKLVAIGMARAVAAIDRSIEAGWTGIFEERNGHARKNGFPCGPGQRFPSGDNERVGVF